MYLDVHRLNRGSTPKMHSDDVYKVGVLGKLSGIGGHVVSVPTIVESFHDEENFSLSFQVELSASSHGYHLADLMMSQDHGAGVQQIQPPPTTRS